MLTCFNSQQSGLTHESQCRSCSPGFYCSETGLSAVSGPCLPGVVTHDASHLCGVLYCLWIILTVSLSPGFYCLERSQTATPMLSESGSVCPAGHFCTEGSSVPSPCPAGSYRNQTGGKGKDECKPCPLGKQEIIQTGFMNKVPSASLKICTLFECLCQAGSRIYQARLSVIPVLRGSSARSTLPAPPGGAPLESPALCPAQLATSVLGRIQTVCLSPALEAPTAPARVSPP